MGAVNVLQTESESASKSPNTVNSVNIVEMTKADDQSHIQYLAASNTQCTKSVAAHSL